MTETTTQAADAQAVLTADAVAAKQAVDQLQKDAVQFVQTPEHTGEAKADTVH